MGPIRRGTIVVLLVVAVALGTVLATALGQRGDDARTLVVPDGWQSAWDDAHVREGDHVALAWGDRAGEDPTVAPDGLRFDPDRALVQLEALHALDVGTLGLGATEGPLAARKVLVVVEGTWTQGPGAAPDAAEGADDPAAVPVTHGAVVDGVALVRVPPAVLTDPGAATDDGAPAAPRPTPTTTARDLPAVPSDTPWELARGFAEAVQHLTEVAHPGHGLTPGSAATLRTAASAYLATLAVPGEHADLSDLVSAPQLAWGSPRHGAAGWLLLQHLAERSDDALVRDLWTRSLDTEHVLGAYARLTSANASALNRRIAQYAMHAAVGDDPGTGGTGTVLAGLDPVLLAHRTTPVETVPDDPGHHRVTGAFAPAAYGYTVVRLVPDGTGADVRVRVRGHAEALADDHPGWSFGMVAVGPGGVRHSPVTEATDAELRLALRPGEQEVYLVVTATPTEVVGGEPAGFAATVRYPYEFRVAGAAVADPAATTIDGGTRHANGGGWVEDGAQVDPAAWVGPGAVVRAGAEVGPEVRLDGRAWVEGGARLTGAVVVRDAAVVQGAARLSGSVLVGGDAVVGFTCDAGVYTSYRTGAACDPASVDSDVNPVVTPFPGGEVVLADEPAVAPTAPGDPTADPAAPGATATPAPGGDAPGTPAPPAPAPGGAPGGGAPPRTPAPPPAPPSPTDPGVAAPPAPVPAGACTASYELVNAWPGGFQGQVRVTATAAGVRGWVVTWTTPAGVRMTEDAWGAAFTYSGGGVTAESLSWNGTVAEGSSVVLGFNAAVDGDAPRSLPSLTCERTG